jgi:hypothetical protein
MSSGTSPDPIQPDAPVTRTRMTNLPRKTAVAIAEAAALIA